jgi:hypothetical protein
MTIRTTVSILAVAVMCSAAGLPGAAASAAERMLAETTAPLEIPAAPATQATPPAATAPQPGTQGTATTPATPSTPPAGEQDADPDADEATVPEDEELSIGEIPIVETVELTPDIARRALDSYIAAKEKYVNSDLDQFENLQDFVDQTEEGKAFESDIKAAGFANVSDWNLAITTLSLTYGSLIDDQSSDLLQQVKEVEEDPDMAQDIKDRMVKALKALIPSENNKKVVAEMMDDPVYAEKLKLLDIEEE